MSEIVTKEALGSYLKKSIVPGSQDDIIRLGINAGLDGYCKRTIAGATYTEKFSVRKDTQTKLIVRNPPIRDLTSFQSGQTTLSEIDSTSYVIADVAAGIIETIDWTLTMGVNMYTVTYDGGYDPIPEDLQLFAMSLMAREIQKASLGRHGMRGRAFAGGSSEFFQLDLEPVEKIFLAQFKLNRLDE